MYILDDKEELSWLPREESATCPFFLQDMAYNDWQLCAMNKAPADRHDVAI